MITTRTRGMQSNGADSMDTIENRGRSRRGMEYRHEDTQISFVCDICNEEFANNHKLLSHKRRHNVNAVINYSENSNDEIPVDDPVSFPCDRCGKVCRTRRGLVLHGIKVHNDNTKSALTIEKLKLEDMNKNEVACEINSPELQSEVEKVKEVLKLETEAFPHEVIEDKSRVITDEKENGSEGGGVVVVGKKSCPEFLCRTCGKILNTRRGLVLHEVKLHNRQRVGKQNVNVVEDRKISDSEEKVFQHDFKQPQSKEETSEEKLIQCDKCLKTFKSAIGLIFHETKMHDRKRKGPRQIVPVSNIFKCRFCIYATKLQMNLVKHEKTHLSKEQRRKLDLEKVRRCHLCSYSSADNSNFSKHLAQTHKLGAQRKCRVCPYQSFSSLAVNSHMKRKHKIDIAPSTTCSKCNTKFKSLSALRNHRWQNMRLGKSCGDGNHSKNIKPPQTKFVKPFEAEIEKAGNITQALIEPDPQIIVAPPQPSFLHQCQLCDKRFATKVFLKKHCNYFHSTTSDVKQEQPMLNTIKSENQLLSFENSQAEYKTDIVIKKEPVHTQDEEFQVKKETQEGVQKNKLLFATDTPELQCQFCFVVCWNQNALVNHLKRHR